MNNQDVMIERMFAQARTQAPEASFEETKKQFLGSLVLASGGVLATKAVIHLFTKKWIIMMTIVSVATSAALVATTFSYGETEGNLEPNQANNLPAVIQLEEDDDDSQTITAPELDQESKKKIKEILVENGVVEEDVDVEDILDYADEDLLIVLPEFEPNPEDTLHKKNDSDNRVQITPYSKRFEITEYTTEEDLEKMKIQAEQAGIKFSYKAHFHESKLEDITISMKLSYQDDEMNTTSSHTLSEDDLTKDTKIVIGWMENDEGKAYQVGTGDHASYEFDMNELDSYMIALDDNMSALDAQMSALDGMVFAFDCDSFAHAFAPLCDSMTFAFASNCGEWASEFEFEMPEIPEIPELYFENFIQFEIEELNESIEELESLEGVDQQKLDELNRQLDELQRKLDELEDKLQEELEEREREREEEDEHEEHEERDNHGNHRNHNCNGR